MNHNTDFTSDRFDLIVAGGGLAGHSAALQAADMGASVLLLEKTPRYGGSTTQSSGSFAFAGTQAQRDAGYEDSAQNMEGDLVRASGNLADPNLISLYIERQADAYEWLRARGVVFHPVSLSSNQGVPRTHATDPTQLMDALHARVTEHPSIRYVSPAALTGLLAQGNRVTGVQYVADGEEREALTTAGVVLATGGFSRDADLIRKFAPKMANALRLGGEGNAGDGLRLAWKLGADVVDMPYVNGTFGISLNNYPDPKPPLASEALLRLAIYRGGIAVNLGAERFADESVSYKTLGELCLQQKDGVGFQVWDQDIMDQSVPAPNSTDFESAFARGLVRRADSIAELARSVGLDAGKLEATINRYNEDVRAGRDTVFGRASLGKGWGTLVPIARAPFYIYPCTTAILATYCGLKANREMRVVDVLGETIPGLFAAGEIVGGFHGSGYMSGSSLSKSVIFGRVAAETALAAVKESV
ncbi:MULTISPECIES: FAD-dependent oxidoreductase [unclassified Caballeronia]|uniref:FAD-dependent oxidoreductase n=1 Tax=unclassified Caballeronia TaxID=2646786 RepID=UPI002861CEB0|nr:MULTISPECIES: FAD-dependent oxidoreductase [unclassified Caballeronia]MDR5777171.1 FAD-dependent oxidoreductase [Caballeronia sp. LZ002]MDR5852604.1 FAD-dependent oxidoreductase [Caballeronia sp. LZ003]